jgi:hypothetical protein
MKLLEKNGYTKLKQVAFPLDLMRIMSLQGSDCGLIERVLLVTVMIILKEFNTKILDIRFINVILMSSFSD